MQPTAVRKRALAHSPIWTSSPTRYPTCRRFPLSSHPPFPPGDFLFCSVTLTVRYTPFSALSHLADSIEGHGLSQSILVKPSMHKSQSRRMSHAFGVAVHEPSRCLNGVEMERLHSVALGIIQPKIGVRFTSSIINTRLLHHGAPI